LSVPPLPSPSFWDEVSALESHLERAASLLGPSPFLGVSLPGLLMWGDLYGYSLAQKNDLAVLLSHRSGEVYAPRPPQPFTQANLAVLFDYLARVNGPGAGLSRVEGLTDAQSAQAETWGYRPRGVSTDYLYDRSRIAGLHGDAFRDRRNELNQLTRNHPPTLRPLTPGDLEACDDLYGRWMGDRAPKLDPIGAKMMAQSRQAHRRLLERYAAWGLEAWILEAEGRLAAYSVIGPLSPDTLGVYAEVSDLTLKGAAAYIFVTLCRRPSALSRVDSGDAEFLPSLRESKERWHPVERRSQFALDPLSADEGR